MYSFTVNRDLVHIYDYDWPIRVLGAGVIHNNVTSVNTHTHTRYFFLFKIKDCNILVGFWLAGVTGVLILHHRIM